MLDGRLWTQYPDGRGGIIDLGQEPLPKGMTIRMALDAALESSKVEE
jgi:hypothetical protein